MDSSDSSRGSRARRDAAKRVQETAVVQVFDISGESVSTVEHECLVVGRTRDCVRLISEEPLPVGERVDITFGRPGTQGGNTVSGVPRNLALAYESSGFLVDVELFYDRDVLAWTRRFH